MIEKNGYDFIFGKNKAVPKKPEDDSEKIKKNNSQYPLVALGFSNRHGAGFRRKPFSLSQLPVFN